uniref:Med25 domain-containing protein n=1 Tax=Panagrellus redivivus TaxID=6233 RepID=A0A7E4VME2_PANRE
MLPPPGSHLNIPGVPNVYAAGQPGSSLAPHGNNPPGVGGAGAAKRGSIFMSSESLAIPPIPVLPLPMGIRRVSMASRIKRLQSTVTRLHHGQENPSKIQPAVSPGAGPEPQATRDGSSRWNAPGQRATSTSSHGDTVIIGIGAQAISATDDDPIQRLWTDVIGI